jgi:pimeloyl-ACP methyl ester carboxylesterase
MTAAGVNGITIEYEIHGEGEPLILVMGLGNQLIAWPLDFVNRIAERGFQVIRFDNRDVGLSSEIDAEPATRRKLAAAVVARKRAKAPYRIADMADDTAGLLGALGIARAHVVGASMGGMIAQSLAIRHPATVGSLVSIMSNAGDRRHGRPKPALLAKVARLQAHEPGEVADVGAQTFRLISGPHYDEADIRTLADQAVARHFDEAGTARQLMAILASPDRTPELARLDVPTLVIHGLLDPLVRPSGGVATAKAIPGSRLLMFPDMGHDLPRVRWDEIIDAIVANARRGGFRDPATPR